MTTHMGHLSYGSHYQDNTIITIYGPAHVDKPSIERKITMMKNIKKIAIALLGTTVASTAIGIGVSVCTDEESTKKIVLSVWDDVKPIVMRELELKKEPTIVFTPLNDAVMSTDYVYTAQGFAKTVIATESDYTIKVNLKAVRQVINYFLGMSLFRPFSHIDRIVVKQLLLHESRHIWQAESGFHIGKEMLFADLMSTLDGHGEKVQEVDANEWALNMASNKKEEAIFYAQKVSQESVGKVFEDRAEMQSSARKVLKTFWNM